MLPTTYCAVVLRAPQGQSALPVDTVTLGTGTTPPTWRAGPGDNCQSYRIASSEIILLMRCTISQWPLTRWLIKLIRPTRLRPVHSEAKAKTKYCDTETGTQTTYTYKYYVLL